MKTLVCFLLCVLVGAWTGALGQEQNKAGTTAAQFLRIGVGARQVAMGGATSGVVDDASAMYWNPSGLVGVPAFSLFATHTDWFADLKHQYFGIVIPVGDDHRIGISATILTMGDMEVTTELEPQGTGTFFSANDVAVGVSYAARLVNFFSFGATVKYVNQSIYNESASGFAVDMGTILTTGWNGVTIGMAFTNFGTTLQLSGRDLQKTYDPNPNNATNVGVASNLATEAWELPINFRVGIGWSLVGNTDAMLMNDTHTLRLAIDGNHPNDAPENASVGLEYSFTNVLFLRGGYQLNDDVRRWSYGVGLLWEVPGSFSAGFDYAMMDLVRLGSVHVFSLAIGL